MFRQSAVSSDRRFENIQRKMTFYAPTKLILGALTFLAAVAAERLPTDGFFTPMLPPPLTMLTGFR